MIEVILFCTLTIVLGYSFARFFTKNILECIALSAVFGLAIIPVLVFIARILHIPINYFIIIIPGFYFIITDILKRKKISFTVDWQLIGAIIVTVVFAAFMYAGSANYPYLENDDPWSHAVGAQYVSAEQSVVQTERFSRYLEPYPPYFTALLGIIRTFSDDIQFTMKAINASIIGLSALAAFFLFRSFFGNGWYALTGAIVLSAIPGYMSHFIWSQTLAIPVFLITLFSLNELRKKKSKKLFIISILLVFSSTIIQQSTAVIFAITYILFGALDYFNNKKLTRTILAVIGGGVLSFLHWAFLLVVHGYERFFSVLVMSSKIFTDNNSDTSGGIIYSISDFLFPAMSSKIDQATGIGWLVVLLVLFTVAISIKEYKKILKKENMPLLFSILFLLFSFLGTMGNALPIKLFPHRFWVFLAIACALLFVAGLKILLTKKDVKKQLISLTIITAVVLFTLMPARIAVQHATWPPGVGWTAPQLEIPGYLEMSQKLPHLSPVLPLCNNGQHVTGFNMYVEVWNPEIMSIQKSGIEKPEYVYDYAKNNGYKYMLLDGGCVQQYGLNETQAFVDAINAVPIISRQGFLLLEVI